VLGGVFGVAVALEDVVVATKSEKRVGSGSCSWKECWRVSVGLKGRFRGQIAMLMLQGRPDGTIWERIEVMPQLDECLLL